MLGIPEAIVIAGAMVSLALVWSARHIAQAMQPRPSNPLASLFPGLGPAFGPAPTEVPHGENVQPDTELAPNMHVMAEWQGMWFKATIISLGPGDMVRIHYDGWDSMWDETVPRDSLKLEE